MASPVCPCGFANYHCEQHDGRQYVFDPLHDDCFLVSGFDKRGNRAGKTLKFDWLCKQHLRTYSAKLHAHFALLATQEGNESDRNNSSQNKTYLCSLSDLAEQDFNTLFVCGKCLNMAQLLIRHDVVFTRSYRSS